MLIFYFSSKDSKTSNSQSKELITIIVKKSIIITNKLKITKIETNEQNLKVIVNKINYPVRKLAHYIVYFILGMLLYYTFINFNLPKKSIVLVIIICFIYALTDEYHQTFSQGRTAKFTDCIIDTFGSICGCSVILYKLNKQKNIKE